MRTRCARDGSRPKRSVLFAAWNSEERGLLGAWAYTEQPLAPLSSIAAVLNMDMIGRNEEIPGWRRPRFNGSKSRPPSRTANALNVMAFSRAPDITAVVEQAQTADRARAEEALRQQHARTCSARSDAYGRSCSGA
jgi:Zn-dependent M28 family amino/carboxypeptidase